MLYRFGECSLDTACMELRRGDRRINLEPQVFAILTYLIEHRDRVVRRAELQKRVWAGRVVTDSALNVRIRAARRAVGDDGRSQSIIGTMHRTGYRFVANVSASASTLLSDSKQDSSDDGRIGLDEDVRHAGQPTLVVLPLQPLGDSKRAAVVAQGLTCDITTRIGRARSSLIVARGTAFNLGPGPHDVRAMGKKLGVRYVVQGTAQIASRKMSVIVALADATTRREIWSEQYVRKVDDWMRVQEEIADLVVGSLQSAVERAEQQRSLLMPSANLDAWSAYHRGCHFMYRFTTADCARAESFFRRAIELEPNVPRPYAGLSFVHFQRAFLNISNDRAGEVQQAHDLALHSLGIDPSDPMGHWALSRASMLRDEYQAAKQELETAIELNPSYAIAHYSLGWVGMQLGERRLCLERIGWARLLSPYDPLKFAMYGVTALNLALMGRTAEATALSASATLQPGAHYRVFEFAAVCHALSGQRARARALYSRVLAEHPRHNINDFLRTFPFQVEEDVRQIRKAFDVLKHA
jgi:TolB-like protein